MVVRWRRAGGWHLVQQGCPLRGLAVAEGPVQTPLTGPGGAHGIQICFHVQLQGRQAKDPVVPRLAACSGKLQRATHVGGAGHVLQGKNDKTRSKKERLEEFGETRALKGLIVEPNAKGN